MLSRLFTVWGVFLVIVGGIVVGGGAGFYLKGGRVVFITALTSTNGSFTGEKSELEAIKKDQKRVELWVSDLDKRFDGVIHSSAELTLARLDQCIKLETEPEKLYQQQTLECGNFTDWFLFEIDAAREAGASKKDIDARLDRVLALALQKKYFSGFLRQVDDEGPGALRKYIEGFKK